MLPKLAALVLLALMVGPARAQETVLELDDSGQWVEVRAPAAGTAEAEIATIRRLLAEDRPVSARSRATSFVKRHRKQGHPLLPEATLLLADAKSQSGDEFQALYDYEEVINAYPESPQYVLAIERELEIAILYARGKQRRVFFGLLRIGSATSLAEELLIRVQERLPGSALAERAGIELADFYYRNRDMVMASDAYDLFLRNYPRSVHERRAMLRRILANVARYKGPEYDASGLVEAQALIEQFRARYPLDAQEAGLTDALIARLDESAGAQILETARYYLRADDEVSARFTLRRLLVLHPRTVAATQARRMLEQRGWMPPEPPPAESLGPPAPSAESGAQDAPVQGGGG
ncbi:MAG: outer membrane protein assembly factor BamD [Phycisphaeraceae bacterium]|nr:outer membrane protein assembly factor BamD [Phycisphaeraceae bacterium]